jgi:hypothetical protein
MNTTLQTKNSNQKLIAASEFIPNRHSSIRNNQSLIVVNKSDRKTASPLPT